MFAISQAVRSPGNVFVYLFIFIEELWGKESYFSKQVGKSVVILLCRMFQIIAHHEIAITFCLSMFFPVVLVLITGHLVAASPFKRNQGPESRCNL